MDRTRKYVVWMAEKGCYDRKEYTRYIFDDVVEARYFIKGMMGVLSCRGSWWTTDKDPKYFD